jgi:hypothetical protein
MVAEARPARALYGQVPPDAARERSGRFEVTSEQYPNFFVLGAIKAGTTSLHSYLGQHPQIFMPRLKEVGFFQTDDEYSRGLSYLARTHYRYARGYTARGDATASYLYHQCVADRIEEALPRSARRFVVLMRDPVKRAYSAYLHMVRVKLEQETFERGLALESERLREDMHGSYMFGYAQAGLYGKFLEPWIERFGSESVLPVFSEDLRRDPAGVLQQICDHIDVDPDFAFDLTRRLNPASEPRFGLLSLLWRTPAPVKQVLNTAIPSSLRATLQQRVDKIDSKPVTPPAIDPACERDLRAFFADDIRRVEILTGRDLSAWRAGV